MHMTRVRAVACSLTLLTPLAAACDRSPSTPPATTQAPAPAPAPAAPAGPRVYVSDETGSRVVVVDPATRQVVRSIDVGKRPRGISVSNDGTLIYVALSGSPIAGPGVDESKLPPADRAADGIGVIDLASGTLVRKYQSGQDPEAFALSNDGKLMFISNEETAELSALELDSGTIKARVKVGEEPEGVTTRPDGQVVYVTCEGTNEVVGVDVASLKIVARIPTGPRPRSIAFDRAGRDRVRDGGEFRRAHDLRHGVAQGHQDAPDSQGPDEPDAGASDGPGAVAGRRSPVRLAGTREVRCDRGRRHRDPRRFDRGRRDASVGDRHQP